MDAADEDAQAAIDLAKEALASKQQVESLLQERLSAIGRERCHVAHAVTNQEKLSLRSTGGGAMVDVGPLTQRTVDAGHAVAKAPKESFLTLIIETPNRTPSRCRSRQKARLGGFVNTDVTKTSMVAAD